ncbi:MAG: ribosomal-protein-alanine N-acetyltransferase [Firmicutes bacterium]|nr:ribosomal-protein-alanine N-acetyltransferase [Bacillota bacterium]
MAADVQIRQMRPEHLNAVMAIEAQCFTTPWSSGVFSGEVRENPYAQYLVAQTGDGEVIGYAGIWLVLDEAHVTNIAVAPNWQRRGIARKLLRRLLQLSLHEGARRMTLEVRKSNIPAQKLYLGLGFKEAGIRPRYYTDNNEDAVIMWLDDIAAWLERNEQDDG